MDNASTNDRPRRRRAPARPQLAAPLRVTLAQLTNVLASPAVAGVSCVQLGTGEWLEFEMECAPLRDLFTQLGELEHAKWLVEFDGDAAAGYPPCTLLFATRGCYAGANPLFDFAVGVLNPLERMSRLHVSADATNNLLARAAPDLSPFMRKIVCAAQQVPGIHAALRTVVVCATDQREVVALHGVPVPGAAVPTYRVDYMTLPGFAVDAHYRVLPIARAPRARFNSKSRLQTELGAFKPVADLTPFETYYAYHLAHQFTGFNLNLLLRADSVARLRLRQPPPDFPLPTLNVAQSADQMRAAFSRPDVEPLLEQTVRDMNEDQGFDGPPLHPALRWVERPHHLRDDGAVFELLVDQTISAASVPAQSAASARSPSVFSSAGDDADQDSVTAAAAAPTPAHRSYVAAAPAATVPTSAVPHSPNVRVVGHDYRGPSTSTGRVHAHSPLVAPSPGASAPSRKRARRHHPQPQSQPPSTGAEFDDDDDDDRASLASSAAQHPPPSKRARGNPVLDKSAITRFATDHLKYLESSRPSAAALNTLGLRSVQLPAKPPQQLPHGAAVWPPFDYPAVESHFWWHKRSEAARIMMRNHVEKMRRLIGPQIDDARDPHTFRALICDFCARSYNPDFTPSEMVRLLWWATEVFNPDSEIDDNDWAEWLPNLHRPQRAARSPHRSRTAPQAHTTPAASPFDTVVPDTYDPNLPTTYVIVASPPAHDSEPRLS